VNAGPTTIGLVEIEEYCEAVRIALADLSPEIRDDLLDDLPDHLREALAEGDGSLRDRLGEPAEYARELRSAIALDSSGSNPAAPWAGVRPTVIELIRRSRVGIEQGDRRLGRLLGYPRLADLALAIRPGWWVLRGWLVAQLICTGGSRHAWQGVIPEAGHNRVFGALVTVIAIVASIWLGRWSQRFSPWPRALLAAGSAAIAIWALIALAAGSNHGVTSYVIVPAVSATPGPSPVPTDPNLDFESNGAVTGGSLPIQSRAAATTPPSPTTLPSPHASATK
jgi:hypothetical protein